MVCGLATTAANAQEAQAPVQPIEVIVLQCDATATVTDADQADVAMRSTTDSQATAYGSQGAVNVSGQSSTTNNGTITTYSKRQVAVRFVFELADSTAKVKFPAALVPTLHSGNDKAGWWKIKDFGKDGPLYTGKIGLNFLNKPRFTIDRRSGDFELRGGIDMDARGSCQKIETNNELKF